jgi:hypothetical protein
MTEIIAATTNAVTGASTAFTTTNRGFWLHASGFRSERRGEHATVKRVGPSGEWEAVTNKEGEIRVSAYPNTIFVDLPAGTYQIDKTATAISASIGYEEES